MAISVVGATSAAGTTVTLPTHQAGDIIIVSARRGNVTPASIPVAGGAVPTWTSIQSGGANALSLVSAYTRATDSAHQSGTWTNAAHMTAIVLRTNTAGAVLGIGASQLNNGNATQFITYPILTLMTTGGTSMGVRVGTRVVADSEVANAPVNWTNQVVQPAAAGALMAVHTRAALTANLAVEGVNTTGTSAAYRAHSIEVVEIVAGATSIGPVDEFTGADSTPPDPAKWNTGGLLAPMLWGNELELRSDAEGTDYAGVVSVATANLTGGNFFCKVRPREYQGSHEAILEYVKTDDTAGLQILVGGGTLFYGLRAALVTGPTYDETNHAWWRIAESGGLVSFWTSLDGTTWNLLGVVAKPAWATTGYVQFFSGHWQAEAFFTDTYVDNFNTLGAAPVSYPRTAADTITVADTAARGASSWARAVADSATVSDAAARTGGIRSRTVVDTIAVSDTAVRTAGTRARIGADTVAVSDVVVRAAGTRIRTAADSVTTSDIAARATYIRARTASDTVVMADAAAGVSGGAPPTTKIMTVI